MFRLEHIPLIVGALFGLLGLALVVDALLADGVVVSRERRRRQRAERNKRGELMVGLGVLALAAALAGRDAWAWTTVAVLVGTVLVTGGALMNLPYLRELFAFRGPLRRAEGGVDAEREAPIVTAAGRGTKPAPDVAPGGERRAVPRENDGPRRIR